MGSRLLQVLKWLDDRNLDLYSYRRQCRLVVVGKTTRSECAVSEYGMANGRRWSYLSTCLSVTPGQWSDAATGASSQ